MPAKNRTILSQRGNPIANNPLMRKGGVHRKSHTSRRQKHKRETRRLVAKYMGTARDYRGRGNDNDYRFVKKSNTQNKQGGVTSCIKLISKLFILKVNLLTA